MLRGRVRVSRLSLSSFGVVDDDDCRRLVIGDDCSAKQATRRRWNEQWGRIDREGNIWWLGSRRRNWEAGHGDERVVVDLTDGKERERRPVGPHQPAVRR
ncbi:hypothetical protein FIBSPDRAFT_943624 [Athelia psychrophila]|uniref:Uncharacterized protein n=1 Tax=Athelia psychrophila TaxID=1759441 RepID=A0A166VZG0_9AGAM|nr:hypothetical protein FIBSPDRAFT_943624 [Fibularhizoctonia sp. CBS 109695]